MERYFGYEPLSEEKATRGTVGIPRVLNMYENYPFWFTFFNELGFRVVLSPPSNRKIYELGIESIPSESECYPAKLAHGHVEWLIKQGINFIFYPCIPYERQEFKDSDNHYNCPIVTSYPENIKNNMDEIVNGTVNFKKPFMSFKNEETIASSLIPELSNEFNIPAAEIKKAVLNLDILSFFKCTLSVCGSVESAITYHNPVTSVESSFFIKCLSADYHIYPPVKPSSYRFRRTLLR